MTARPRSPEEVSDLIYRQQKLAEKLECDVEAIKAGDKSAWDKFVLALVELINDYSEGNARNISEEEYWMAYDIVHPQKYI
jgi:hypothetical protein